MSTTIELQNGGQITLSTGPNKLLRLEVHPHVPGPLLTTQDVIRLRAELAPWADPLRHLFPGDAIEVMDKYGNWSSATFDKWTYDGGVAVIHHPVFLCSGRGAIRLPEGTG